MFPARFNAVMAPCLLLAALVRLSGCTSSPQAADSGSTLEPRVQEQVAESDQAPLPTLAAELSAGDGRKVQDLSLTLNVTLEELPKGTAPGWYAQAATEPTRAAGTSTAATLPDAFDAAITLAGASIEARGGNPSALVVEQGAWQRLPTGQFVAWAALGDGSRRVPPPIPRVANISQPVAATQQSAVSSPSLPTLNNPRSGSALVDSQANKSDATTSTTSGTASSSIEPDAALPSLSQAKGTSAGEPNVLVGNRDSAPLAAEPAAKSAPDAGVPGWWSDKPSIRGGRLALGLISEGQNGREAARAGLRAAREQLKAVVGEDPREVITDRSVMVTLPDGRVRLYAMMSCLLPAAENPK
jgi:hypothetical protein